MSKPTRTFLLVQERLGKNLSQYVARRWNAGASWNEIARDLYSETNVGITSETLRIWFPNLRPQNRAKSGSAA